MDEWVVLLHVAAAFWFVAGLLGRNITMARARAATDIRTLDELVTLSGRFEHMMVIPGSFAVVVLGLFAAWALGQPLAGANNWWLLTSLLLFLAIGALVPIVFLPHGKVFEHEFEDAKTRGESGAPDGAAGPGRSKRTSGRARGRRGDHHADGHQAVLTALSRAPRRSVRPTRGSRPSPGSRRPAP